MCVWGGGRGVRAVARAHLRLCVNVCACETDRQTDREREGGGGVDMYRQKTYN